MYKRQVCSVVLPLIFSRVFPLFFAPVGFPEDLSGDVRGRTGAALKSDHGQSALGRPFPVIVDNFSIKCRRGGPSNAIKPYICFRYRFPMWRANPPGLKGNPVKVRNYPRSCKFLLGGTFSQPLAVRAGKACRPEQVRRPADICNHSGFRVKSDRMHPPRFILLLTLLILSFDLV